MTQFNIALTLLGCTILLIGFLSRLLKEHAFLSEPMLALIFGVILGPKVTGLITLENWPSLSVFIEELTRVTLAIGLMGVALRVPSKFYRQFWSSLAVVLIVIMSCMWIMSALIIWLFTGFSFLFSLLAAAPLTPTDPIVASSLVTGHLAQSRIPGRIRNFISSESGFNDGLAYPFMVLSLLLLEKAPVDALKEWFLRAILWEVAGAIIFGFLLGLTVGKLLALAEKWKTIADESILAFSLALSFVALGLGKLIGTDGILVVFVAGIAFSLMLHEKHRVRYEHLQETINMFFTLPSFLLLGSILPWEDWRSLNPVAATGAAVVIILIRRPPAVFAFFKFLKPLHEARDVFFFGWFGPIGIAALFYSIHIFRESGGDEQGRLVWAICTIVICFSVIIHGMSATFLTKKLYPSRTEEQTERE